MITLSEKQNAVVYKYNFHQCQWDSHDFVNFLDCVAIYPYHLHKYVCSMNNARQGHDCCHDFSLSCQTNPSCVWFCTDSSKKKILQLQFLLYLCLNFTAICWKKWWQQQLHPGQIDTSWLKTNRIFLSLNYPICCHCVVLNMVGFFFFPSSIVKVKSEQIFSVHSDVRFCIIVLGLSTEQTVLPWSEGDRRRSTNKKRCIERLSGRLDILDAR